MADDVVENAAETGDSILVIGGDQVGMQIGDYLAEQGWDQALGARPLRRTLQRLVEDPLAEVTDLVAYIRKFKS